MQTFVLHISTYVTNLLLVRCAPRLSALNYSKYAPMHSHRLFEFLLVGRFEWPRKSAGFCMAGGRVDPAQLGVCGKPDPGLHTVTGYWVSYVIRIPVPAGTW